MSHRSCPHPPAPSPSPHDSQSGVAGRGGVGLQDALLSPSPKLGRGVGVRAKNALRASKILGTLFALSTLTPVLAHNLEISGDVGATFHIEPNHQPKVGFPSQTWFALTRRGGKIIPLSQCNCQLAVYRLPRKSNTPALMKPALRSLNIEKYKGIPSAQITFPKSGLYQLELIGTAKPGASFQPFKFTYTVTVTTR
jgi:hypothetical protein